MSMEVFWDISPRSALRASPRGFLLCNIRNAAGKFCLWQNLNYCVIIKRILERRAFV